jgi:MtN3 and saliva related transmembrane protein
MATDMVGWISAAILVMTISRQVYTQWRTRSVEGVSKWLFIGQLAASMGFTIYSYLVENWVFVFANFFIFLTAVAGEIVYMRNKRLTQRKQAASADSGQGQPVSNR